MGMNRSVLDRFFYAKKKTEGFPSEIRLFFVFCVIKVIDDVHDAVYAFDLPGRIFFQLSGHVVHGVRIFSEQDVVGADFQELADAHKCGSSSSYQAAFQIGDVLDRYIDLFGQPFLRDPAGFS